MKKHLALTVLILIVLSIVVSCGEDPFFHHVTIKNAGETLGTETVRDGSKYTLPKEYKGIENLSGWTIDDDETVYDLGQEITVTKDITINAVTVKIVYHTVTIKNDGESVGTEKVKDGDSYTLPREYEGIENLQGWTIGDDKTVYDLGQKITVTGDITINAVTLQPYFNYKISGTYCTVSLKDEYRTTVTDVVIPSSYEGITVYEVTGFDNAVNLESVTFPDTIKYISGFSGCTSLKSVVIPKSVKGLSGSTFYNCTSLESVTFENGSQLSYIDRSNCFANTKIKSITLPEGLTFIGAGTFSNCKDLTSIFIPNSVYEIGSGICAGINANATITIDRVKDSIVTGTYHSWGTESTVTFTWTGATTTYTVTYRPNGATGESYTTEVKAYGEAITIDSCPWTREGYTFKCWNTESRGYETSYNPNDSYSGPTTNLYAIWEKNS